MEAATQIIETLAQLGVTLKAVGPDRLRIEPASRIPPELMPRIREVKPQILAALRLRRRPATCASSCYETEPNRWIHHPWDGCNSVPPVPEGRTVERKCWHCEGERKCPCIACDAGPCLQCSGTGKVLEWVH
jgi:hypothetical protein